MQEYTLGIKGNASMVKSLNSSILWYRKLGHVSEKGLSKLVKQGILGSKSPSNLKFYEHCIFVKHTRVKFTKG